MVKTVQNTVDTPIAAYNAMAAHWELIDALLGGTLAMRAASDTYLPRETKEDATLYNNRLNRSVLYGAYEDTVEDLADRPFAKPVTIQGELPDVLADILESVDGQGTNLTQFARELLYAGTNAGLTHVLVDVPATRNEGDPPLTKAAEQQNGIRPIFVHIKAQDLIGWRYEIVAGKPKLVQIRWRESREEADGTYGTKTVEAIRVYTDIGWELHEKNDNNVYVLIDSGTHTYPDGIPLVTLYLQKTGFMTAEPPLEKLAWLNLSHWQNNSDQMNIVHYGRTALLFGSGFTEDEVEKDVVLGPNRIFRCTNENAKLGYVEPAGAAMEAGRKELEAIQEQMEVLGVQPLMRKSGTTTATGQSIDEARSQSSMQAWVRAAERTLEGCFGVAALWLKLDLPDDFKVDIFNEFGLSLRANEDIKSLIQIRQAREISHETFLREVRRRAVLSETLDIDEEIRRVAAEGPSLGLVGVGVGAEDD